jgi:hypothetical protein
VAERVVHVAGDAEAFPQPLLLGDRPAVPAQLPVVPVQRGHQPFLLRQVAAHQQRQDREDDGRGHRRGDRAGVEPAHRDLRAEPAEHRPGGDRRAGAGDDRPAGVVRRPQQQREPGAGQHREHHRGRERGDRRAPPQRHRTGARDRVPGDRPHRRGALLRGHQQPGVGQHRDGGDEIRGHGRHPTDRRPRSTFVDCGSDFRGLPAGPGAA